MTIKARRFTLAGLVFATAIATGLLGTVGYKQKPKAPPQPVSISIDPNPKGEFKIVGGSLADDWNLRLVSNVGSTLPLNHSDREASTKAITAVCQAMADMAPADPVEGNIDRTIDGGERGCARALPKGLAERERASVISRVERNFCNLPTRQRGRWCC